MNKSKLLFLMILAAVILFGVGGVLGWQAHYLSITDACLDYGGQVIEHDGIVRCDF